MPSNTQKMTLVALASVGVALAVLALKVVAWRVTGSVALYSDALESIVNVIAALVALWTIRISVKPADAGHPFGHHKVEYFSAALEGGLILVAAVLILQEAYQAFVGPRAIENLGPGLAWNGMATVINTLWAGFLIRVGRRWRSPALGADGWHILTDVVTSVGVIGGLVVAKVTGLAVLDPAMAALVAVNILWSGWRVLRESFDGLMDKAVDSGLDEQIRQVIANAATGAIEVHDLRTRVAGRAIFIEFHMVVPAMMTVADAHDICDRAEARLQEEVPGARVTIHIEPEEKAKNQGVPVL